MNLRHLLLVISTLSVLGCRPYWDRSLVNLGTGTKGQDVGLAATAIDKYVKQGGLLENDADAPHGHQVIQASAEMPAQTTAGSLRGTPGGRSADSNQGPIISSPRPDFSGLRVGAACRVDLIRPLGQGLAYEGTIAQITQDELVLKDAIREGPSDNQGVPMLKDLPYIGRKYFGGAMGIGRFRVDKPEVRIAKSQIAAVRRLDQRPSPVEYLQR